MPTDFEIEEKYGIVFINDQRCYYESLVDRNYSLETTTPVLLEAGGKTFVTNSWKQLLIDVCTSFLEKTPRKKDELLNYESSWNHKRPFSTEPGKYWFDIGQGIYLLCNHSAIHACWLLRDILNIFDVDLSKCKFIIHRPPFSEPTECRRFYEDKIKNAFRYYYVKLLKHSEEKADQVLRNIDKLNKLLAQCSEAYDNFYLFDNNNVFGNYKAKFLDFLRYDKLIDEKNIYIANKYLTILGDFYKTIR